ncbi:MAG: hypothetical protein LBI03_01970 [Clostridiales bacterium]|jgi:hypothetical protein|nr:hypothetical protein [Clostridiales bacterium]
MTSDKLKLIANQDGSCDLVIQYGRFDTEFSMDFLSKDSIFDHREDISDFLTSRTKDTEIKTVWLMISDMVVASVPFTAFFASIERPETKYSIPVSESEG